MNSTLIDCICENCGLTFEKMMFWRGQKTSNICLDCQYPKSEKGTTQEIVIKSEMLDTSNIEEGEGSNNYRPSTLDDYTGQEEAKLQINTYLKGCKEYNEIFPHTFLSAPPGHGKSLLADIIADLIGKKIVICTGGELKSEQQFIDKVVECEGGVIFVDEANRLSKKVGFFMLPVIEQFRVQGKKIKPFTVIFATTHKGDLSKDLDALIQRCDLQLDLEHYTSEQLVEILKNYLTKQYPKNKISEEILKKISINAKRTPRIARILLRNYIFTQDWDRVMKANKIVKEGLTKGDVRILKYLQNYSKGVGKNTIANYMRVKPSTYEHEYEPFLIFKELITISNKRKLTEKGRVFLNNLNERENKCITI